MINNKINVFELVARVNDDFGNHVYIARSFPSIDIKLTYENNLSVIKLRSYCEEEPECSNGYTTIKWNENESNPIYHLSHHLEQTCDGETTVWDEINESSTDIRDVVKYILHCVCGEDESSHDEDPSSWNSGMYPDEYFDDCFTNWKGVFKDLDGKVLSNMWA